MKKLFIFAVSALLLTANVFANAEWSEMVASEAEERAAKEKVEALVKKADLKISVSEFYSGKLDGKSVSFPGTNLYLCDGNPWMIKCHDTDNRDDAVITLSFKNLADLNPLLVINNGYIKGDNYQKYGRPSTVYISVEETGLGDYYWLEDTPVNSIVDISNLLPAPGTTDKITVKVAIYKDIVLNYYACIDAIGITHSSNPNYFEAKGTNKDPSFKISGNCLVEKLKSGTVVYSPANLYKNDGKPWVANSTANSKGIGAKLQIKAYYMDETYNQEMIIANGFQNGDSYEKNSRLKKFKLTYNGKSEVFEIKDTKDLQTVNLRNLLKGVDSKIIDMELEVLEVYPGFKYNDLCVDAIMAPALNGK